MIGKAQIVGWVSTEPKNVGKSDPLVTFGVGFYTGKKDNNGNKETFFIPVSTFYKTAEQAINLLNKGDLIFIEGTLGKYAFRTKDGIEKETITLTGNSFRILREKQVGGNETQTTQKASKQKEVNPYNFDNDYGEIPF